MSLLRIMNIDQLKTYQPPEKVTGLEILAKLGIPVPTIRRYIAAHHEITDDLPLVDLVGKSLMVRSAHPMEDRFSSGAFQSIFLYPQTIENLPAILAQTRASIVNNAQAKTNLTVARDIKHKLITGFRAEDMGVFMNEYHEGVRLTIVPLEGNSYALCYFAESKPNSQIIDLDSTTLPIKLPLAWPHSFTLDEPFLSHLKTIHHGFPERQEMEVVVTRKNCIWVQTKTVSPRAIDDIQISIPDHAIRRVLPRPPHWPEEKHGPRLVSLQALPMERAISAPALVINEAGWLKSDNRIGRSFPPNEQGQWQDFFRTICNPDYPQSKRPIFNDAASIILEKYAELRQLALNYREYILVIIHQGDIHAKSEFAQTVRTIRAELARCAIGQVRGFSDFYTGIEHANEHALFGTVGPQQIVLVHEGILVHDNDYYNSGERKRLSALINGTNIQIIAKADGWGAIVL